NAHEKRHSEISKTQAGELLFLTLESIRIAESNPSGVTRETKAHDKVMGFLCRQGAGTPLP
ncbi:MAG: hypothetical protein KJN84_01745, partial [Bacteroidia bacterium]|nr:hypothetical protein [Bacteroidia bacterium]